MPPETGGFAQSGGCPDSREGREGPLTAARRLAAPDPGPARGPSESGTVRGPSRPGCGPGSRPSPSYGRVAKSERLSDPLLRRHPPVDFRLNRRGARARVRGSRRRIRHDGILRRGLTPFQVSSRRATSIRSTGLQRRITRATDRQIPGCPASRPARAQVSSVNLHVSANRSSAGTERQNSRSKEPSSSASVVL